MGRKPTEPTMSAARQRPPTEQEARRAREAEALRANLKRRKEQSRARKANVRFAPGSSLG